MEVSCAAVGYKKKLKEGFPIWIFTLVMPFWHLGGNVKWKFVYIGMW